MVNLFENQQPKGDIEKKERGILVNLFLSCVSPTKVLNNLGGSRVQAVEVYPLLPANSPHALIVMYLFLK